MVKIVFGMVDDKDIDHVLKLLPRDAVYYFTQAETHRAIPVEQLAAKAYSEGLKGKVPGIVEIKVEINGLASSNADLMLDSTFENEEALKGYSVHPEHVKVATEKVRPFTAIRSCFDYEV